MSNTAGEWAEGTRVVVRAEGGWADGQTGTIVGYLAPDLPGMVTVELDDEGGRFLAHDYELRTTA